MKKNFCFHLQYFDDYKEIQYAGDLNNLTEVFILCKYSFENQNVNISNLIQNPSSMKISGKIKLNFSANQIMKFKKDKIDFYILDKERLYNIFAKMGNQFKFNTNIFMEDKITYKILYFQDEFKFISFTINKNPSHNANINQKNNLQLSNNINLGNNNDINNFMFDNNQIHNNIKLNQTTYQQIAHHPNPVNIQNKDDKTKIIQILILLYGNEKEIMRLYSHGAFKLQQLYLINKAFIDKFKEIYYYKEICNILISKGVNTFKDTIQISKNLVSLNEINTIYNKIIIDTNILTQLNLTVQSMEGGPNKEYRCPVNFVIIHESILNLIKSFTYTGVSLEYEINFGKSSLCLRWIHDNNKIYIYNYNNHSFNLSGVIELYGDAWKDIYDRHLSKKMFSQYLTEKQINLNILKQKQDLLSSGNKSLGYIYLTSQITDFNNNNVIGSNMPLFNNNEIKENNIFNNENKGKNTHINTDINNIYKNFIYILNAMQDYYLDLPNNDTIKNYILKKTLNNIPVFIIETKKLNYCKDLMKQSKNNWNEFSSYLSEADIIPCGSISELNEYSLINDEILKYFKIQNINILLRAFYFINKSQIYIFYPSQNCLLNAVKYDSNKFKLKNLNIPPPIPTVSNHTLGLENIGATCYMNATLQCLCHVSSLKDYFLDENRYYQEVMAKPTARLTQSLAEVVRKLWSQTNETYYAPRNFKNIISQMNPLFQGIQANDSKDLVLFIFENIHNELNNPSQNPTEINLNNIRPELYQFRQNYYTQNYSIISQIFYYEQSSIMKCLNCGFETYNFNIMNMIIFPLEKVRLYLQKVNPQGFGAVTLYDCFDQNEQIEMLEGANQIYCNSCRQNSNATSSNKLYTCPEVLTIILNRGKGLEFEVEFSFPMTISIEKYITDKTCDPNYELIGVLTHHGPSGMAGHFVAYCKSPVNGQWYFYNDATVTQCSSNVESEMQSKGIPYILFYQRRKTKMEGNYESKCIYFAYEGKEGYYDYTDDNKMLYEVYSEFRNKYDWAPEGGRLMLTKNDNMPDLDEFKSLKENGINDKDKICIIKD